MTKIINPLLKQAIADAEAVRETAVANAKLVLEESITPQIRDMIARRLRVEAEMAATGTDVEEAKELPFQDAEAPGSSEMPADSSVIGSGDNKEPSDDAFDASGIGDGGENQEDSHTDWYDDWSESDFDLDEVIKELEEDIAALEETHGGEEEKGEAPEHEKAESPEHEAGEIEAGKKMEDESWMKKETQSATDPNKFASAKLKMDEKDPTMAPADAHHADDEEEIDLEEILAELEADDDLTAQQAHGGMDKTKEMAAKLAGLKNELAQYRAAFNTLRERLQEVNLLNAKLLFTNKMFRKDTLTNEQKIRIVESFDRATTVREVKIVYAALVENLATAAKTFNASRKKVVAEGFASKATPSTAPKSDVIVENVVAKRLQELAGII